MSQDDYNPSDTTILIVDDKEENRELLQQRLERSEYELVSASDGEQALVLADGLLPDLILLDVMMPGIDGFEVCRRLRSSPRTREIPVIMITALHDAASRLKGIEVGADDFLAKPVDLMELETRVASISRLGRYQRLLAERSKFELFANTSRDACVITTDSGEVNFCNAQAATLVPGLEEGKALAERVEQAGFRVAPKDAWTGALPEESVVNLVRRGDGGVLQWLRLEEHRPETMAPNEHFFRLSDITPQLEQRKRQWSFQTVLAHKFRTPLTGIIGTLELLQLGDLDEDGTVLQGLHRSATRLREQIESVLHYVERPGLTEGPAVTVGQIEPLFRRIAGAVSQSGVRCEVADGLVEARLPLTAAALEVILTELVTNAVKFHPDHRPELSLCVTASEPDRCAIALLDNGLTLPEDKLGELARPYYQAEEYFTGETPGMGLGLAMVSTLATEQGGRLSLHNRAPGPGIEARVVLPLHEG